MLFIHLAEPASGGDLQIEYFFGRGLVAFQDSVFCFAITTLYGEGTYAEFRTEVSHSGSYGFYVG